jgi:hypothetical protein
LVADTVTELDADIVIELSPVRVKLAKNYAKADL